MDQERLQQILAELHDIHLPLAETAVKTDTFVFWPLLVFISLCGIIGWLMWRRRTAWRRQVSAELNAIEQLAKDNTALAWQELARLLRRLALYANGSRAVARLTGEAWLISLDQLFGAALFTEGSGRGLAEYPYKQGETGRRELADLLKDIRQRLRYVAMT